MQLNGDGELLLGDVGVSSGLIEVRGASAIAADGEIAEPDVDALGVYLRAGVTDGRDQTAPIRVAASPGGFDQRRMCNRLGDFERLSIRSRSRSSVVANPRISALLGKEARPSFSETPLFMNSSSA